MASRALLVVVGAMFVAAIACQPFQKDNETSGISDSGTAESGGTMTDGGSGVTDSAAAKDGGSGASWPGPPPEVHVGCAGRSSPPRLCEDFEGTVAPAAGQGKWSIGLTGADHHFDLVMTDSAEGYEARYVNLPDLKHRIRWSFDLDVETTLLSQTEFMQAEVDPDNACALQLRMNNDRNLTVSEYCAGTEQTSFVLELPKTSEWISILVAVDFDDGSFQAALRDSSGISTVAPLKLKLLKTSAKAELGIGISYSAAMSPGTRLNIDNVVADWD